LNRLGPTTHNVSDPCEQVLEDVHAEGAFSRDDFNSLRNVQVWVGLGGQEDRFDFFLPDDLLASYFSSFLTGASCNMVKVAL
jgi:hypothetical protein